ncbi:MAG: TOBE domain-containing protein, partial [Pseudomonadota bacterium]
YDTPANAFVASFIGRANFLTGQAVPGGIEVPGQVLSVASGPQFADGTTVTLSCRPERACLDQPMPESNRLPAEITFVRNIGATRDIHLKTDAGPIVVEYAVGENAMSYEVGQKLFVHLPPKALRAYPADPLR